MQMVYNYYSSSDLHVLHSEHSPTHTKTSRKYSENSPYLGAEDVSLVVHVTSLLLQVELDPVVEANDLIGSPRLSHKHVLKPTGVIHSCLPRPSVQLVGIQCRYNIMKPNISGYQVGINRLLAVEALLQFIIR